MIAHSRKVSKLKRRATSDELLDHLSMLLERRRLLRCFTYVNGAPANESANVLRDRIRQTVRAIREVA